MTAPLLLTHDPVLTDELLRLAAAAGVTPELASDAGIALRGWAAAPVVLVGVDAAASLARLRPARRAGVYVVTAGPVADEGFRLALEIGAEAVLGLPRSEGWLVERLTDLDDSGPRRGRLVGVVGGCGGAGATTFAAALGQVAAAVGPTLVVDADPHGLGLDRVLGPSSRRRGSGGRPAPDHRSALRPSLREAVPARGSLGVLTWPPGRAGTPAALAVREALSAGQRGHDVVVADLPRAGDGLVEELVTRCDEVVVLTLATVLGVAATARWCARHPRGHLRPGAVPASTSTTWPTRPASEWWAPWPRSVAWTRRSTWGWSGARLAAARSSAPPATSWPTGLARHDRRASLPSCWRRCAAGRHASPGRPAPGRAGPARVGSARG
ncbi:MAG: septum site determining protein [Nocardioides sp.]